MRGELYISESMKVAVVIPLWNKAATVRRALESVAAQTYGDFEAIIVDDGSTDASAEIAESFADPRFRVIRQANAGPGAARNRGLKESRSVYVAFLDADDEWLPTYLEAGLRILETGEPRPAAVARAWYDEPGHRVAPWLRRRLREGLFRAEPTTDAEYFLQLLIPFSPCSTIARREIVERYGGFYTRNGCRYGEDAHLWLKVLLNEPVWFSMEPLVRFYRDAASLSGNLKGMRPVEPFLTDPEDVFAVCPAPLRPLLNRFLSMRAMKTATLLCLWSRGEEAMALRSRFLIPGASRLPWYVPSMLGTTAPFSWAFRGAAAWWRWSKRRVALML